jgi:8-hydroxy-5-deazaflavin:NADPH oxidoreductase
MATAIGRRFARSGFPICFGSRTAERATALATAVGPLARGGTYVDAVAFGPLLVNALEWPRSTEVLRDLAPLRDRILLDCSNPEAADGRSLAVGFETSGAEELARIAGGASVVKALNHVYAELLDATDAASEAVVTVLCGDDPDALATVERVLRQANITPVAGGPLHHARYTEPFAMLMVHLVRSGQIAPAEAAVRFGRP